MSPELRRKYTQFIIAWTLGIWLFVPGIQLIPLLFTGHSLRHVLNDYLTSDIWLICLYWYILGTAGIAIGFAREWLQEWWRKRKCDRT